MFALVRLGLSVRTLAADDPRSSAVAVLREYLDALIVAGLAALLLSTYVIRTYYIPSVSMVPTLRVEDIVLVDRLAYNFRPPHDGDIALFRPPVAFEGSPFVKRIVGAPGDRVRIANGVLYRNGSAVAEPYVNEPTEYDLRIAHYDIYVNGVALSPRTADIPPKSMWQAPNRIPRGFYLMLGDNRNYSDDSHIWGFAQFSGKFVAGPLAGKVRARFDGKALAIIWPFDHLRILH